jgi:transposase
MQRLPISYLANCAVARRPLYPIDPALMPGRKVDVEEENKGRDPGHFVHQAQITDDQKAYLKQAALDGVTGADAARHTGLSHVTACLYMRQYRKELDLQPPRHLVTPEQKDALRRAFAQGHSCRQAAKLADVPLYTARYYSCQLRKRKSSA